MNIVRYLTWGDIAVFSVCCLLLHALLLVSVESFKQGRAEARNGR